MAPQNLAEKPSLEAAKRDQREATREFLIALNGMTHLLRRCLESDVEPTDELGAVYEAASHHVFDLALCVSQIAVKLNVS
jgi:hypothetical protein